jgi:hypothetical protein
LQSQGPSKNRLLTRYQSWIDPPPPCFPSGVSLEYCLLPIHRPIFLLTIARSLWLDSPSSGLSLLDHRRVSLTILLTPSIGRLHFVFIGYLSLSLLTYFSKKNGVKSTDAAPSPQSTTWQAAPTPLRVPLRPCTPIGGRPNNIGRWRDQEEQCTTWWPWAPMGMRCGRGDTDVEILPPATPSSQRDRSPRCRSTTSHDGEIYALLLSCSEIHVPLMYSNGDSAPHPGAPSRCRWGVGRGAPSWHPK